MDVKENIQRWVRPEIRALSAYHVPPADGLVKLDAMENPWPWPAELRQAWLEVVQAAALNRYPDPTAGALQATLRAAMSVPAAAQVMLGNGSDELIQMIVQTIAAPGRVIMAPEPTFVMYRQIAAVCGLEFSGVPLSSDFSLDRGQLFAAIEAWQPAVIFLAYPNNPTGNLFDANVIRELLTMTEGLVVVDEAYAPFTDASFMSSLGEFSNLLVLRTVSKMGLAGIRLGMLAGDPAWLEQIDKTRLPYNIGTLNQLTGVFAMQHKPVFDEQAGKIRSARGELDARLRELGSLTVYPSEANFILFRVPEGRADALYAGLREAGVLIKNLNGSSKALQDCLRVTVGQPDENGVFLDALARLL
ncbi:MAG: histidinol-phosphate transaminase [Gammaproteobacteria bacterium]|nr:histidinol-phosphate transaminase [Gammaproteobacteria bacterium]